MATPKIFVSSTYYDLKHLRSSFDLFIESLGFEAILSEKGNIAYSPDLPLDESCYREAGNADIFILIIGGRYGSEASGEGKKPKKSFFKRYDSITKKEYESAVNKDIPIYILIDNNVHSEYQTYLRNKENKNIKYAHVDSVNIFQLIEDILSKPRNNPIFTFERFVEIESWLREQWAGLFRELLFNKSEQQQLIALTSQVSELQEVSNTMKLYMEAVMTGITPDASTKLIESERKRLQELEIESKISKYSVFEFIKSITSQTYDEAVKMIKKTTSFGSLVKECKKSIEGESLQDLLPELLNDSESKKQIDEIRDLLQVPRFNFSTKKAKK